ncbi:MAG: UDP-N-acetylmuramoyl-L-alanine--D-glutamate ligase [Myxococcales bacterium]|nr:UDP-N-acetylmuramoyl-L-alanine--D-glutamate ligase [Myxococcales bacterium]
MPRDLTDKRVLVVGLGKSGLGAARLALRHDAREVIAFDDRGIDALDAEAVRALVEQGARLACGPHGFDSATEIFRSVDLVVVSPGFPLARPEFTVARQAGAKVVGEVEFASWFLNHDALVIGISGTNGKSTVTALTGALCAASGAATFTGGNLGAVLSDALVDGQRFDFAVLELSSFQLEGIDALHPQIACLTNLTPDHIDRYADHAAYGAAKKRLFRNQTEADFGVVNAGDAGVLKLIEGESCQRFTFGFGQSEEAAARFDDGTIVVRIDRSVEATGRSSRRHDSLGAEFEERYQLTNRNLRGPHNAENAMAAILCARLAGVDAASVQRGLDAYPGLHHRLESVGTIDGVEFINDSKATNVDSTAVALKSFERGVWLIAGGQGKGLPYRPLVEIALGRVAGVLTIGEDAPLIEAAFRGVVPVVSCGDLETATRMALNQAHAGDVVLLSPACASYDQFKNFEARGDTFRALVQRLSGERDEARDGH